MVYSVSIPEYETGKPVMYVLSVDLGGEHPPYTIKRRYNDFLKLAADVESEMGEPVAVAPPPKPGLWEKVDIEQRRNELEIMLTALLRVPDFADSLAVNNFLDTYSHRHSSKKASIIMDWISTTSEISKLITDARNGTKNISYARQCIVQAKALTHQLQRSVENQERAHQLGRGEFGRRKQQLDGYLLSLHQLERKRVETDSDPWDQLFPNSGGVGAKPDRVLGETSETRKLNNAGLMQQQQTAMDDQDLALEEMLAQVARQKELGLAINTELVKQNEMLEELDGDVHRVNAKLNEARRKTSKLNR